MDASKNNVSLDELANKVFDDRFIDGILAYVHRDSYQFIRIHGDERAHLFTKRLTERAKQIKEQVKQEGEVKLYMEGWGAGAVECKDFNYFFFPYIAEEGDNGEILQSSYKDLRNSLCEPNQRLVMVLIDTGNHLKIDKTYHIDIGYFIGAFERRNSQSR